MALIPDPQRIRYQQYWDHNNAKSQGSKRGRAKIEEAIMDSQASALGVSSVDLTNEVPDLTSSTPATIIVPASNKRGRFSLPTNQPSIDSSIKNNYQQGDIRRSNNARLEMAIADLFHCENLPDRAIESH